MNRDGTPTQGDIEDYERELRDRLNDQYYVEEVREILEQEFPQWRLDARMGIHFNRLAAKIGSIMARRIRSAAARKEENDL